MSSATRATGRPRSTITKNPSPSARSSPSPTKPAEWQRDLSVSYDNIANVLRDAGDRQGALDYYKKSLAIREKLAKSDEARTEWQRDLAIGLERIGSSLSESGDNAGAIKALERELSICQQLIEKHPDDIQSRLISVVPHVRLADLKVSEKADHLQAALAILKPLAAEGGLDADRVQWIPGIEAALLQVPVQAAHEAKDYTKAAALQADLAQATEKDEVAQNGKAGARTASAVGGASWYQLFDKQFEAALASSGRAMDLQPDAVIYATNYAHAVMFLGREQEARALYLKYRGQRIAEGGDLWEVAIVKDFAELEKAGRTHPLMDEIRAAFSSGQTNK